MGIDPKLIRPVQGLVAAKRNSSVHGRLAEIVTRAERIEIKMSRKLDFFDCGANLEGIYCPVCGAAVSAECWQARMDADEEGGFWLLKYPLPSCGKDATLHDLDYDWPQGFGYFALEVVNPCIGKLAAKVLQELEAILGMKLRVVYRHL